MRPSSLTLYQIDPKEFIGVPHEKVLKTKVDALLAKKHKLALELRSADMNADLSYEVVSAINSEIKYLDKAITHNLADLDEMGIGYTPKETK